MMAEPQAATPPLRFGSSSHPRGHELRVYDRAGLGVLRAALIAVTGGRRLRRQQRLTWRWSRSICICRSIGWLALCAPSWVAIRAPRPRSFFIIAGRRSENPLVRWLRILHLVQALGPWSVQDPLGDSAGRNARVGEPPRARSPASRDRPPSPHRSTQESTTLSMSQRTVSRSLEKPSGPPCAGSSCAY